MREHEGTASFTPAMRGATAFARTLDDIIALNPQFSDCNFLKIDTDGHDLDVILGARETLGRSLPAVLFECDHFGNESYVEACEDALQVLRSAGYQSFVLYDNVGYIMGKHSLADIGGFKQLLFYQITSPFYYFDILLMREDELRAFLRSEVAFFVERMRDKRLQDTAVFAFDVEL